MLTVEKASSQNLRVAETNPQTDPRWVSFVAQHPSGSVYHHPGWLAALEREYGQTGVYLVCEDNTGRIRAILPMLYTRGLPFGLGGTLTGRRLSSLPRTPVAGPLSIDSYATRAVLYEAMQRVSGDNGLYLQVKTQSSELDGLVKGIVCTPWRLSYVLQLKATEEGSFRIADSDHRCSIKRAVNKAHKSGIHVRPAETLQDLHEWHVLYLHTMRRSLVPARPYRFFVALWELLRPQGIMRLLLAEHQDAGKRRVVAGSLFLEFGRTVSLAFNGSRLQDLTLRPNDLIYWEAINDALRRGFKCFDFGEVAQGRSELARYKSKWGSEPIRLYRYYYPTPVDREIGVLEQKGYATLLGQSIWQRLPLGISAYISDRIYSYL